MKVTFMRYPLIGKSDKFGSMVTPILSLDSNTTFTTSYPAKPTYQMVNPLLTKGHSNLEHILLSIIEDSNKPNFIEDF